MKYSFTLFFAMFLALVVNSPHAMSRQSNGKRTLQVHLKYTGSGVVDEKHRIFVVLWDSPDFVRGGVMPVKLLPASSKTGSVTFEDVEKSPAFISAAYDPKGEWDGASGPPPDGASLGLYAKSPPQPEPIELKPGAPVSIELIFDDTVKMSGGQPSR